MEKSSQREDIEIEQTTVPFQVPLEVNVVLVGFMVMEAIGLVMKKGEIDFGAINGEVDDSHSLYMEDFEILHGDLHDLHDTKSFLSSLAEIAAANSESDAKIARELKAAAAFFIWEEEIFVARAPGRLDVIGGIADYSGSLVLQVFSSQTESPNASFHSHVISPTSEKNVEDNIIFTLL